MVEARSSVRPDGVESLWVGVQGSPSCPWNHKTWIQVLLFPSLHQWLTTVTWALETPSPFLDMHVFKLVEYILELFISCEITSSYALWSKFLKYKHESLLCRSLSWFKPEVV